MTTANTNWDEFFSPQNLDRPLSEGAYKEAKRRSEAAKGGSYVDAIVEDYIRQYESFSKTSAKTRTLNERRAKSQHKTKSK